MEIFGIGGYINRKDLVVLVRIFWIERKEVSLQVRLIFISVVRGYLLWVRRRVMKGVYNLFEIYFKIKYCIM